MPKYTIHLTTHASATVEFETDLTDPQEIADAFYESGADTPTICGQCSGYDRDWSLDIGDEWEIVEDTDGTPAISPAK